MDLQNETQDETAHLKDYGNLLKIPKEIIFPLELSIHLKERLQVALEEIFRLKKQLFNQDHELTTLHLKAEKSKSDKYFETKEHKLNMSTTNPQMATKVVELCKKNRDMVAEMESFKTRMKQIMAENDQLKESLNKLNENPIKIEKSPVVKTDEEILSTTQQLAHVTNKMMDYRRQTQQTRLELRIALKALSHEVGEGTTPQNVLTMVSNPGWRGRQQQILGLQQKVHELQYKLNQQSQNQSSSLLGGGGDPSQVDCACDLQSCCSSLGLAVTSEMEDKSMRSMNSISNSTLSLPISAAQRRLTGLHQQERNKFEQLEKTSQELEEIKKELKNCQLNLKGSKARVQTLEDQLRQCRSQLGILEGRLGSKQMELQETLEQLAGLKQELKIMKERMKTIRDKANTELMDTSQALIKEKSMTSKLHKTIQEYEEKIVEVNEQLRHWKIAVAAYEKAPPDDLEARKKLQFLELQFDEMRGGMRASEGETRRLLEVMEKSIGRMEEERLAHSNSQRHLVKAFTVIQHGDQCLCLCLEKGQISDKKVLETVEDFRSMVRELKTGDLYHLEPIALSDVKKLRSRVSILSKEVKILQKVVRDSAMERKLDLQNFAQIAERTRQDFFMALSTTVKNKQMQSIQIPQNPAIL